MGEVESKVVAVGTGQKKRRGRVKCLLSDLIMYDKLSGRTETITPRLSHAEDLESCRNTSCPGDKRDKESFDLS